VIRFTNIQVTKCYVNDFEKLSIFSLQQMFTKPHPTTTFFFNLYGGTLGTAATTGLLYQPRMIGDGVCGEIGGMKIGRGNRSTRRKPVQCHFVHHKSHMTRFWTRAAAVGSRRLTAWAMARPFNLSLNRWPSHLLETSSLTAVFIFLQISPVCCIFLLTNRPPVHL
jgi:hypothetical protein